MALQAGSTLTAPEPGLLSPRASGMHFLTRPEEEQGLGGATSTSSLFLSSL